MNSESSLILELWENVRDHIPTAKREDVATTFLKAFEDYGFDPGLFEDLVGEDKALEAAFTTLYGDDPDAAYEDEEDEAFDDYED